MKTSKYSTMTEEELEDEAKKINLEIERLTSNLIETRIKSMKLNRELRAITQRLVTIQLQKKKSA